MLIPCPECERQISNKAPACIHCGFPLATPEPKPDLRTTLAPPDSQPRATPAPSPTRRTRPLSSGLNGTTVGLFLATAGLWIAAVIAHLVYVDKRDLFEYVSSDRNLRFAVDAEETAATWALGAGVVLLATGVLFVIWLYQAYEAAESRGATDTQWSPGWAIGGWFIPLANLVIPILVVNEVTRMSNQKIGRPPIWDRWRSAPGLWAAGIWWGLLLAGIISSYWAAILLESAVLVGEAQDALRWRTVSLGLFAGAAIAAAIMVGTIGERLKTSEAFRSEERNEARRTARKRKRRTARKQKVVRNKASWRCRTCGKLNGVHADNCPESPIAQR